MIDTLMMSNREKRRFLWKLKHEAPGLYEAIQAGRITLWGAAKQIERFPPKRERRQKAKTA